VLSRREFIAGVAGGLVMQGGSAHAATAQVEIRGGLAKHFTDDSTVGTFVARKSGEALIIASDNVRSRQPMLPASTFKIPNSLIAIETGVVDPDKDVFKWDGVVRAYPLWNQDHTLRSAMSASAVPVYQEIARRIGAVRMQKYLNAFDYGNRNIGGGIDRFWLSGDLRIDPLQQIAFIDKLVRGSLPLSQRTMDLGRDIMPVTKAGNAVIRAKTGLIGVDEKSAHPSVGWLVGWAETSGSATVFALNLDVTAPRYSASRMTLAQACLRDIGAI
jgi:beta-lactamase class D